MPDTERTMVLLGAGASVEAGIPAVFDMTTKVRNHVLRLQDKTLAAAFDLVAGGLQMTNPQAALGQVDVEQVLTVTTLLANRRRTEMAPFVAAWHPLVESIDIRKPNPQAASSVATAVARMLAIAYGGGRGDYRDMREASINPETLKAALNTFAEDLTSGQNGNVFGLLSRHIYAAISELTWLDAGGETNSKTAYFGPLVQVARKAPVVVATLNYDNSVERCAEANDIQVSTGLEQWISERRISGPSIGLELLKLHGSTNWAWEGKGAGVRILTDGDVADLRKSLREPRWSEVVGQSLAIVLGGDNKLTARGPFLDLLARFKSALWQHEMLLVIGYSFRDDHVNQIIRDWLAVRASARIEVVGSPAGNARAWQTKVASHPTSRSFFAGLGDRHEYHPIGATEGLRKLLG